MFTLRSSKRRYISLMLVLVFTATLILGAVETCYAADEVTIPPEIFYMRFIREKAPTDIEYRNELQITGVGLKNPTVFVGEAGAIPVQPDASSNEYKIVIKDSTALAGMIGRNNHIKVYIGSDLITGTTGLELDLQSIPSVGSLSKSKAYVGEPLTIKGDQFDGLNTSNDELYVAGTKYALNKGTDAVPYNGDINIIDNTISIETVKSGNITGLSDVKIVKRTLVEGVLKYEIESTLKNSITVVNKISDIQIDRIDPNAGPRDKSNIISIYGKPGYSNFLTDMRLFVESANGIGGIDTEAVNLGVITGKVDGVAGKVIGITFRLPDLHTRLPNLGKVDLVLTTSDKSSELVIPDAFTFLDIGNTLTIDEYGVNPDYKKETEEKLVEIRGRNIGYFDEEAYDGVEKKNIPPVIWDDPAYKVLGVFNNKNYKLKYEGTYNNEPVTIIRQFSVNIDGDSVVEAVYNDPKNFTLSKDTINVFPPNVNLDPNEPQKVDVIVKTTTTIFKGDADNYQEVYNRVEEAIKKDGFTFLPDEEYPTISTVMPAYGPSSQEVYMTIKGSNFQVLVTGERPRVRIGERECTVVGVYDDSNKAVDGKERKAGTKLRVRIPKEDPPTVPRLNGISDVVVINPSGGQNTLVNGFEFRNPVRDAVKWPSVIQLKENFGDLRGGLVSGETVAVTGANFDTSATDSPRIMVTIDGEKATLIGKVSSDGRAFTVIPPPGTIPGPTQLQVINDDGSMASANFTYNLITTNPKITSIVPRKGSKGTKLIIKGEDFIKPDGDIVLNPSDINTYGKRKGTVVYLGGRELNAYNYNEEGYITEAGGSIYYRGDYSGRQLDGCMVTVIDSNTIYVDIPDSFYSFDRNKDHYLSSSAVPLGDLKIEVLNPDGAKSKEDISFKYMDPTTEPVISSIAPNQGSVDGGTVVTITGNDFKKDLLEVYFGSEKSPKVDFINSTTLRALVPKYPYPLPSGSDRLKVPVMVVNYDGGTAVYYNPDEASSEGFIYKVPGSHPVIIDLAPKTGSAAGNETVVITGMDFRRSSTGADAELPKVYFGGQEAEVVWNEGNDSLISEALKVITPKSTVSGPVDVVIVNHDSGTYTYKSYTYTKSTPRITSVTPNIISSLGNINVQINGSGFRESNVDGLFRISDTQQEQVGRHTAESTDAAKAIQTIVAFGDQSTMDKRTIDTVRGPNYTVVGDLRFTCDVSTPGIFSIKISKASDINHTVIERKRIGADGRTEKFDDAQLAIPIGSSHMFIINHKLDLGAAASYDEGILVETTPSTVVITRRIAPYAALRYENTQLAVKSPPIDRTGSRSVYVINDDGGTAAGTVNIVSPDSRPVITSIDPKNKARLGNQDVDYNSADAQRYSATYTFVPQVGGAFITITGSDFRKNVKVFLNDKPVEIFSRSINDDQLVVKLPSAVESDLDKDYRLVVVNEDGGTYDSSMLPIPHFIRYKKEDSSPVVESITPQRASSRGSNDIYIKGDKFQDGVKVFIDGKQVTAVRERYDLIRITIQSLELIAPTPGKKTVQVQNPDFGFFELKDGIEIVSSPEITGVFDDEGRQMDPAKFSVDGGEAVTLKGFQFYTGARVIIGGKLKVKSELQQGENGTEGYSINNKEMVIVGGTPASNVQVTDEGTITFTTPKITVGATSIIVINTDGGVSNSYDGVYQKPIPDIPGTVAVEVVDGDTIKLEWQKREAVNYYEIYVSESEDGKESLYGYRYAGSIVPTDIGGSRLRYYLEGLNPETWYSVKLKSVGQYGASEFSNSTAYKQTLEYKRITYYDSGDIASSGIRQKDDITMKGIELIYSAGEKSLGSNTGLQINFDQPGYLTANPKKLELSLRLVLKYPSNRISINDRDMEISLTANNVITDEVITVNNSKKDDAELQLIIDRQLGERGDDIRLRVPSGYKVIAAPFRLDLNLQVENTNTRIKSFKGDIQLALKYSEASRSQYGGGICIAYYDTTTKRLQLLNTQTASGKALTKTSKTGDYVLLGKP